jgi:hypothetical protein
MPILALDDVAAAADADRLTRALGRLDTLDGLVGIREAGASVELVPVRAIESINWNLTPPEDVAAS